jgi:hypothetical protein
MELKTALVDLGHKSAFDLLLKEAWNPEVAVLGNSTLPTVCIKLNVMSTIHLRKLIATLVRENGQRDDVIDKLEERIGELESRLNEMKNQLSPLRILDHQIINCCKIPFRRKCKGTTNTRGFANF